MGSIGLRRLSTIRCFRVRNCKLSDKMNDRHLTCNTDYPNEHHLPILHTLALSRSDDANCVSKKCYVPGLMTLITLSRKYTFLGIILTVFY